MSSKLLNMSKSLFLFCFGVFFVQVDTSAQIPWYEKLSEFKLPWEVKGNKQTAINNLSLRVRSGQMLAVIGSSGETATRWDLKSPFYQRCKPEALWSVTVASNRLLMILFELKFLHLELSCTAFLKLLNKQRKH